MFIFLAETAYNLTGKFSGWCNNNDVGLILEFFNGTNNEETGNLTFIYNNVSAYRHEIYQIKFTNSSESIYFLNSSGNNNLRHKDGGSYSCDLVQLFSNDSNSVLDLYNLQIEAIVEKNKNQSSFSTIKNSVPCTSSQGGLAVTFFVAAILGLIVLVTLLLLARLVM